MARSQGAQRLLLINPPSTVYTHARITAGITYVPQVSLATLGAIAEREGHTARVLDLFVSARPESELARTLAAYEPTVVGFTVMTPNSGRAAALARAARKACPDALLVAGGPHPSAMPDQSGRLRATGRCTSGSVVNPSTGSDQAHRHSPGRCVEHECRASGRQCRRGVAAPAQESRLLPDRSGA